MRWIRAIPRRPYTGAVPDETGSPVAPTDDVVTHAVAVDPPAPHAIGAVPVVYIGGSQRSGSTLLDRMLSQVPGHVSAGEVVHLWKRGLKGNELCGCGAAFLDCPFWSEVGRIGFGGWDQVPVDDVISLQRRVDRNRYIVFMLIPALWPRYRRDLRTYTHMLERLYQAIEQVGGGSTIVDSSKHASTAFLLRRVAGLRLRIVHLVRDSRGVAFSLLKEVRRPEVLGRDEFMQRTSPWRSALEWVAFNGLFHLLRPFRTPSVLMRYEDLVRTPERELRRIVRFEEAPETTPTFAFIDRASVTLGVDHTVAGNPMRFKHGTFELSVDEAWRRSMGPSQRRITTALTWPLLLAYRYRTGGKERAS
jgi:hypothetical protein